MDLSDRRGRTSPVLGVARTATDGCRLLRTRPAALAGRRLVRICRRILGAHGLELVSRLIVLSFALVPDSANFRFELDRLVSYDDADLITELQRVSALVPGKALTRVAFDRVAKVNSSTIARRFGTWREALLAADLGQRYGGRTVSQRMRTQPARGITDGQMLAELKRVAGLLDTTSLSRAQFDERGAAVRASAVERRFGSRALRS